MKLISKLKLKNKSSYVTVILLIFIILSIVIILYNITDRFSKFPLTGYAIANLGDDGNAENIDLVDFNDSEKISDKSNDNLPRRNNRNNSNNSQNKTKGGEGNSSSGYGGSRGSGGGGSYYNPLVPDTTNPVTTLNYPYSDFYQNLSSPFIVNFICSVTDNDILSNISLYISKDNENLSLYRSRNVSGSSNYSSWQVPLHNGDYIWNCLSSDNSGNLDWGDENYSIIINHTIDNNESNKSGILVYSLFPDDLLERIDNNVQFSCSAESINHLSSIGFVLNGKINESRLVSGNKNESNFSTILGNGIYNWECIAYDKKGDYNISGSRTVVINPAFAPKSSKFKGGKTTDWSRVSNIKKVCNAVLDMPKTANIKWKGCVNAKDMDFDKFVMMKDNYVEVNSSFLDSSFNSEAEISMENLPWKNTPVIYRNGVLCKDKCDAISYENGVFLFSVSSFSSYTTGANSQLEIWDETDSGMPYAGKTHYPGDNNRFFANYSDVSTSEPITTGTCYINFTDSSEYMEYNSTIGLFVYNQSFSSPGNYRFNITCYDNSYETLDTSDLAGIRYFASISPNGANLIEIGSSSAQADSPGNFSAYDGNVTELNIFGYTTTTSWQGYYGNVTGVVQLANSLGNVMYNWSASNSHGEIYSSTNDIVIWESIECFNMTSASEINLTSLESRYNIDESAVDGVDETFNLNNHPNFFVGNIQFDEGVCNNTELFREDGTSEFSEVLLYDKNSDSVVFASIIEKNTMGFDARSHDFEMVVLEDGHYVDVSPTTYYFYLEIN